MDRDGIILKAKEYLEFTNDISLVDLYNKLWELRNSYHPDKYISNASKIKGEEKFKEIGSILINLHKFVEEENLDKDKLQIIPYDEGYEIIKIKQENINCNDEISILKQENESLQIKVKALEERINKILSKKTEEKEGELLSKYKNSKRNVISVGVIIMLTALISILTKIEEVSLIITKYSPVKQDIINFIIFAILALTIILGIKRYIQKNYINKLSNIIQTSLFIKLFFINIKAEYEKEIFSEVDVVKFMIKEFGYKKGIKGKIIKYTKVLSADTLDVLKDIFIFHLYEKSFIEFDDAHCLDRYFRIKKSYSKDIQDRTQKENGILFKKI